MAELLSGFFSNESTFGRIMNKAWIMIVSSFLFAVFSLPVITIGASWAAVNHVMLKTLRGDGSIKPFSQFWKGFKSNFKQATIVWVVTVLLLVAGYFNIRICEQAGGFIGMMKYGVYALGIALAIVVIYLFPTMAAFANNLKNLIRNSIYFAFHKPLKLIVILFFTLFPIYLTITDPQFRPLYGFIWVTFGTGAIGMLTAALLLPEFKPYLPLVDACGDFILDDDGNPMMPGQESSEAGAPEAPAEKTDAEIQEEMKKLGM